jgi:hypothetical protein
MITKGIQTGATTALELLGRGTPLRPGAAAGPAATTQTVDRDGLRRLSSLVRAFEAAAGRAPPRASDAFRVRLEKTMSEAADRVRALSGTNAAAPMVAVAEGEATMNDRPLAPLRAPPVERLDGGTDGRDRIAVDRDGTVKRADTGSGNDGMRLSAERVGALKGGDGADRITTVASTVKGVAGGEGADRIRVHAETVGKVQGGMGADVMKISAVEVGEVQGGLSDDDISVKAVTVGMIDGGKGDDRIAVTAMSATVEGGKGDDVVRLDVSDAAVRFGVGDGADRIRLGRGTHLALDFGPGLTRESLTVESIEDGDKALVLRFASGESVQLNRLDRSGSVLLRFHGGETVVLHGEPPTTPETELDARV